MLHMLIPRDHLPKALAISWALALTGVAITPVVSPLSERAVEQAG
jgi:hypothetical protein